MTGDLLFLAHRVPYPPDRGDKIRSYHLLRHLSARRRVHLVAFTEGEAEPSHAAALAGLTATTTLLPRTKTRARSLVEALATGRPVSLSAFDDRRMRQAVHDVIARHSIASAFVFSGQMAQYLSPHIAIVMDFVDVDSAKFAAYAREARGPLAWLYRREARLLARFEHDIAARARASLFVSEAELALFRAQGGSGRLAAIENGIDPDRFNPAAAMPVKAPHPLIVFTGQMDYPPNIQAVRWFADSILHLVRRTHPDAAFAIVGRAPAAEVRALARRPGVIVTGEVADVRGWLAAADVVVAPLRIARGIQNKVLEAMAMARPVVASSDAALGIDHADSVRVGADAEAIATHVVALLDHPELAAQLGRQARARVIERYGWAARLAPLDMLFAGPGGPAAAPVEAAA